jgi:hypothetical protein
MPTHPLPPSFDRFRAALENIPQDWLPCGPRSILHPGLGYRITLGVLSCRPEYRGRDGSWLEVPFCYDQRASLAFLTEQWLAERLKDHLPLEEENRDEGVNPLAFVLGTFHSGAS